MACIVIEGVIALVLVLAGLRETVVNAVPDSLKLAIGVGIGLFITLVGLRQAGIVVNDPATGIALGDLSNGPPLIALAGILVAAALIVRGVRGALIAGIAVSTVAGPRLRRARLAGQDRGVARGGRVRDDRRCARPDLPRRRPDGRADPDDLRAVHDGLLRHDRDRDGGRDGGRPGRPGGAAARPEAPARRRLGVGRAGRGDGHVVGDDLRRVRGGRVGGRADRVRVARHRRPVPARDPVRAAHVARGPAGPATRTRRSSRPRSPRRSCSSAT